MHDFFQVNPRARLILTPHSQKLLGNTGSIKCPNLKYVYSKGYDYYQIILCKCFKLPKVSIQQNKHPPPFFLPKRKRIKRKDFKKKKITKNYMKLRGGMREKLGRNFHKCAVYEVHDSPTCTFLKLEICGFYLLN